MKIPFTAIDRWYQEIKDELFDYYNQVYKSANPFDHPVKQSCVEILKKITGRSNYYLNGAIYICKINYFLKKKIFTYLFKKIDQVIVNSQEFKYEIRKKFNV